MQRIVLFTVCAAALSCFTGAEGAFALGEKTLQVGAASGWAMVSRRERVTELASLRPYPVLALASEWAAGGEGAEAALDMALFFDEGESRLFADRAGHYRLQVSDLVLASDRRRARSGPSAALFTGDVSVSQPGVFYQASFSASTPGTLPAQGIAGRAEPLIIIPVSKDALFSPGQVIDDDFSIEFWLYSNAVASGEMVFNWAATYRTSSGKSAEQEIRCEAQTNRFTWSFIDFFRSPSGEEAVDATLRGLTPITPKTWTHHLVRFDAASGLLEYLVNGDVEAVTYATPSGREREREASVYTPIVGERGHIVLGQRFSGILDEFLVHRLFVEAARGDKYPRQGGRVETAVLDLGSARSAIQTISVSGGRTNFSGKGNRNQYAQSGAEFRFEDASEMDFFVRLSNSYYNRDGAWQPFMPGTPLSGLKGRYVEIAVEFYPSADCALTPYLEQIAITYIDPGPPPPPERITAVARDGAVELTWKPAAGGLLAEASRGSLAESPRYTVYYGTESGVYFGTGALQGPSPIDAGEGLSLRIDNLKNGVLYFFALSSGAGPAGDAEGPLSREVAARPQRGK